MMYLLGCGEEGDLFLMCSLKLSTLQVFHCVVKGTIGKISVLFLQDYYNPSLKKAQ